MNIKHNIPLIIGLAIPVLMVVFVAASIYLPALFVKPRYNFLYATDNYPRYVDRSGDHYLEHRFSVQAGHLTEETTSVPERRAVADKPYPYSDDERPKFYIHDVQTDTNREVSLEQAQLLSLSDDQKSPDGFDVTPGTREGGVFPFMFWSDRDFDKQFLRGKNVSRAITVTTSGRYRGFNFVGWLVE